MATSTTDDGMVPVREGEYGERVIAIEPGGVEYIPDRERHGHALNLFWTWNSPNWEFATVFVGVIPVAFLGAGFWPTAVAVAVGTALGCITHGLLTSMGPKFGVPQMIQSRGAFGYLGNFVPAGLNTIFAGIGWFIVNSASGTFALSSLTTIIHSHLAGFPVFPFQLSLAIIVAAQLFIAFIGHNFIHAFERFVFPYLLVVFVITSVLIFAHAHLGTAFNTKAGGPGGATGAFILAMFIAYGYAIGWNPFASDYSRYLPRGSSHAAAGMWAALGVFVSCAFLEIVGAAVATVPGTNWGASPTDQFVKVDPGLLAALTVLGISVGTVSANVINLYSAAMSFLSLGVRFGGLRLQRAVTAVGLGVIGFIVALALQANIAPGSKYEDFLLLLGYWITPWLAVVLVDYWLKRGRYAEATFFDKARNSWKGVVAMVVGIAASVPFWNQTLYTGPLPAAHPAIGDLSFIVGFGVSAILYTLFSLIGRRPAAATA
ncbi:MAG: purine-cytosine permease family protein [Candidatus Dormibacterales bacterium]